MPCGLLQNGSDSASALGTFLVRKPDQQEHPAGPAQTAMIAYDSMRLLAGETRAEHFARGELRKLRHLEARLSNAWMPSAWIRVPQSRAATQASGLAALFDLPVPTGGESAELRCGLPGTAPIGSAVMSRISLASEAQTGQWQQMLPKCISRAAAVLATPNHPPLRQRFRRDWSLRSLSHPRADALSRHGLAELGLTRVRVQCLTAACPISTSRARDRGGHGRPLPEARKLSAQTRCRPAVPAQ